ncbi:MAG: hypothetical protein MRZ79_18460 [Bacteroidia bacterium]|nr:hypothetical protein [Bacteroidia bacterium]
MNTIEIIAEVLKYAVPGILILIGVRLVMDRQTKNLEQESKFKLRAEVMKDHLPLKLAAYERAVLFLERITPEQLIMRELGSGLNVAQYRASLIREIRQEYEHNIAQQVYIHPQAWDELTEAKNQIIQLILEESEKLPPEGHGKELAGKLLSGYQELEIKRPRNAIMMLKGDLSQLFTI